MQINKPYAISISVGAGWRAQRPSGHKNLLRSDGLKELMLSSGSPSSMAGFFAFRGELPFLLLSPDDLEAYASVPHRSPLNSAESRHHQPLPPVSTIFGAEWSLLHVGEDSALECSR